MMSSPPEERDSIDALVIGKGGIGVNVVKQLVKNDRFRVTWVARDFDEDPARLLENDAVVELVNMATAPSPLNINELIEKHEPDIVFFCQRGSEWDIQDQVASANLEREMLGESIIIADAPIITVSLEQNVHTET